MGRLALRRRHGAVLGKPLRPGPLGRSLAGSHYAAGRPRLPGGVGGAGVDGAKR